MSIACAGKLASSSKAWALRDARATLTWAQLDALVNRAANAILAADLGPERRVMVFAHNSVETVAAYLSALHAGASAVPVNFHLTVVEIAGLLRDSGATILFVGPETVERGMEAAALAGISHVIGWRSPARTGLTAWNDWLSGASPDEPSFNGPPRPFLHYTSGTTGVPKATETPPALFPRAASGGEFFGRLREMVAARPPGPALVIGPLYHTGPLSSIRLLGGGTPIVICDRFDPEPTLRAIEEHAISSVVMVPTHFQRLLALPDSVRRRYDVSSLRLVSHTGAGCPVEVKRRMIDWFGPVLVESYGGTESGTTNTITSAEWLARPGSVGKAVAPFELLIIDGEGRRLPPRATGQIYFRDTTGRGVIYFNDPERTRSAHLEPGTFTLGDVGYVDEEGYLYITDRASDMIVSGGVNIYPAEAERVLLCHPAIADAALIGVPHAEMGEEVKALVVLRDGARVEASELDAHCRRSLAGYKCPRSYEFVPDLGRNPMGKLNKRALRRPYWPTERTIG